MKLLENKTAFVTGGSRGIGAAIARTFAAHGAHVGFSYHSNTAAAGQVEKDVCACGVRCKAYQCDVTRPQEVETVMGAFLSEFGDIDILVNNAGIIKDNLLCLLSIDDWNSVINTNLTAAFLHTQIALKTMIAARKGLIINISSVVGEQGNAGQANYAASKAGLIALTKSVAKEVGSRNIRCNAIAPGIIETGMIDGVRQNMEQHIKNNTALKRIGTAEEVASVALFLASDLSNYVTGQVIHVCGGLND